MRKIDINLATAKGRHFIISALATFASAIALIFSFYNIHEYSMNSSDIQEMAERVRALEEKLPRELDGPKGEKEPRALTRDIEIINSYVEKRIFSWTGFLSELEEALPSGVYLLQVSPDFGKSAVSIAGTARSMEDVFSTVSRMEARGFEKVVLTRHSEDKERLVIFNMSAQYGAGR
ncbi:MAG: PilN domain-containing protein [Deltaproteobacteria bacterium]|nr:PilN domain-containing protein [Deltaproteobacteria bacterium]MBZ0219809.1 PilN domain-containing protein [Deltaproteobacteria bacterium]